MAPASSTLLISFVCNAPLVHHNHKTPHVAGFKGRDGGRLGGSTLLGGSMLRRHRSQLSQVRIVPGLESQTLDRSLGRGFLFTEVEFLRRQAPGSILDRCPVGSELVDEVLRLLAGYAGAHGQGLDC